MLLYDSQPDKFVGDYPAGFDPQTYAIQPVDADKIQLLQNGDTIDLGCRKLEILHTPGHTNDSIMLLDRKSRALFTGDTFYPDWLFAFMEKEWGKSDVGTYEKTMKVLTKLIPDLDYLYPCHTKPLADPAMLMNAARAFETVNRGGADYTLEELYFRTMRVHEFDGFAILTLHR
jgi:glyoxylase-like metal-dependent hydrolase (beta-lactamase superfamily II)